MHNLPATTCALQDNRSSIGKSRSIIQMKSGNYDLAEDLKFQVPGLDVHKRSRGFALANLFKNNSESPLEFRTSVRPLGNAPWIENGGIIVERGAEGFPVQVVKSSDELSEGSAHFRFHRFGFGWRRGGSQDQQERDQPEQSANKTSFHRTKGIIALEPSLSRRAFWHEMINEPAEPLSRMKKDVNEWHLATLMQHARQVRNLR